MIRATFKETNSYISEITLKGHALFSPIGTDIVCAGVSTLFITLANEMSCEISHEAEGNEKTLVIDSTRKNAILVTALLHGLQDIASQYPENISVEVIK